MYLRDILIGLICASLPLYVLRIPELSTNVFEIISGLALLGYLVLERHHIRNTVPQFRRSALLGIIFTLTALGGVFVSEEVTASLGRFKSYFILPFIIGFVIIHYVKTHSSFRLPLYYLTLGGALIGIWAIGEFLWGITQGDIARPTAIYDWNVISDVSRGGFANFIGLFLTPLWPLAIGLWHTAQSRLEKQTTTIIGLFLTGGVLVSQSYSAIFTLGILAGLYSVFLFRTHAIPRFRIVRIGLAIISLLGIFVASQISTAKFEHLWNMNERNSITSRIQIWHTSTVILKENPILGIGLADFQRVYEGTVPQLYFPPHEWLVPEPHNVYLATWLHTGLLGFVIFVIMGIQGVRFLRKSFRQEEILHVTVALGFLSMYVHGLLDTTVWKNDLAVLFFVLYLLLLHQTAFRNPSNI